MENSLGQSVGQRLDAGEGTVGGSRSYDQVAALCATFIAASGKPQAPPAIGDYLREVAADSRPTLLRNLLHLELARRRDAGEQPEAEEFVRQLPEFSTLIRQVFYETVTLVQARPLTTPRVPRSKSLPSSAPPAPFLGNYVILRELGRGGMGTVYEAEHIQRKYRVALKTLPALDGQRLHRFKREFRAVAHVNHPNLIGLHSLESDGAHWFLTMDLIEGTDFLSYVRPRGQLDEQRLRHALPQLVAAILALHGQHIIHRDLKPSNVMVTGDGKVVVLDFGLVMELQQGKLDTPAGIEGTPRYMSPEQARGAQVTGAADWYAVGIMLYEALCGEPPFQGANLAELTGLACLGPAAIRGVIGEIQQPGSANREARSPERPSRPVAHAPLCQ